MTITQLEYIIAVNKYQNFAQAAESCFVTQPTLSMQIQKLEEELDVIIFDRSKKPVEATEVGRLIIDQAHIACKEFIKIPEIIKSVKGEINGVITIGVIPTIAPYLVPLFLSDFMQKYPDVSVNILEITTKEIIKSIKDNTIDCGILATPLYEKSISETPLYYEPLVAYISHKHPLFKKNTLLAEDLEESKLLLLTEEHCLRSQIVNLCGANKKNDTQLNYITGSLETIKRIIELDDGITLLPELATHNFTIEQLDMVRYFRGTEPVREVSMVTHRNFAKPTLIDALRKEIMQIIPEKMKYKEKKMILEI